ncbi:sigma-54-dependent transcriptional regulator [Tropicibacter naphthalenivorans]|uniref:Hydrogenase transcriptional regulatory protein hupR1 n=1 Tax=Tropicibacter naphthalenivorans TaxID=441103 RepID=A0A0P1GKD2_9RHOB|nr:sigma-54 dependent transcriptional regulator [Tropicibacter naphthalenivorans]CUH75907.1 Hydrogenase transcriptional regulatory protein hupR1 [Tropicibacter naphthalenivorans]SMC41432.1 DNA-binding transcriptional response regulator, NtrC family, contains REC, AAA-type ATPase, and a Fis-type DNA-binding domains [Tropicibacter naphthalenivorans]
MTDTLPTILLVDDEEHSLASMRMALEDDFDCLTAANADEAAALMEENYVQVIFCDQRMPGRTGVEFLTEVRDRWPETVRIIITGYTESSDMIAAINEAGIYQFLTKPWHPDHLLMTAKNATDLFALNRDHERLSLEMRYLSRSVESKLEEQRKALREGLGFENVLRGPNSPLEPVIAQARQFASFDVPVLIFGENGTGKAALARAMHYSSLRSDRPFQELNCTGVSDELLELELFGARRGALPGLSANKIGLLQKADRGTLFLNGVADLSPQMQLALVRVATEGSFRPLGSVESQRVNVRLLAGSVHDLRKDVAEGRFRSDLYYALARATLAVPPLRERRSDVPVLAQNLLFTAASEHGKPVHGLSEDAVRFLEAYDWPGNLREMENEMVRMLIFSQDAILGPELISRHILQAAPCTERGDEAEEAVLAGTGTLKDRVERIEMRILRETLTRLKWNKSRAANELGLSRVGLRAKIDRYGLEEPGRVTQSEED